MSLFQSLFGSSGSDKADKLRQQAVDAFNSIKTPDLAALQIQLNDYVNQGKITPEQAEASLLGSNAFNSIATDPSNTAAQKQALTQLQQIGSQGGITAIDKAQLQDITDTQNQQNKSQNAASMQQAQQRGVGGSQLNQVNRLINEQGAADRAARSGTDVAANAQARALQAIQQAGQLGGQMEAQQYGEAANKANAQNAIQQFNAQTQTANNQYNTGAANNAQAMNLQNAQNVSNANTSAQNANKQYNAQQNQTVFNDDIQKANGVAGIYTQGANAADAAAAKDQAANVGLTSGLIGAGATALAGPAGGVAANGATSGSTGFNPNTMSTNPYQSYKQNPNTQFAFSDGGIVPDQDKDTLSDEDQFKDFMASFSGKKPVNKVPINFNNDSNTFDVTTASNTPGGSYPSYIEAAMQAEKLKELADQNKMSGGGMSHKPIDVAAPRGEHEDCEMCSGGMCMKHGGKVPGKAKVAGDSPINDTVPATLSPGEVVLPRTVVQQPEQIPSFVEKATKPHDPKLAALKAMQKKGK